MKRSQKEQSQRIQKEKFVRKEFPLILPRNEAQKQLQEGLKFNSLVVAAGSSGVGKTLMATYHAARKLHFGDIKKIILIRAYQPLAGRTTGFLPGTLEEKLIPYYAQMLAYLEDALGKGSVEVALKSKTIEICSLETIRGRSWDDAIVLVDEAQGLFPMEVQALCTRIGENCQLIFMGDNSGVQTDNHKGMSGLDYLARIVQKYNIEDCCFVQFTKEHVERGSLTKSFVFAFEDEYLLDLKGEGIIKEHDKFKTSGRKKQ